MKKLQPKRRPRNTHLTALREYLPQYAKKFKKK